MSFQIKDSTGHAVPIDELEKQALIIAKNRLANVTVTISN